MFGGGQPRQRDASTALPEGWAVVVDHDGQAFYGTRARRGSTRSALSGGGRKGRGAGRDGDGEGDENFGPRASTRAHECSGAL